MSELGRKGGHPLPSGGHRLNSGCDFQVKGLLSIEASPPALGSVIDRVGPGVHSRKGRGVFRVEEVVVVYVIPI
jgi:hypothetical protein